ncbi:hypothetical protein [Laspinema palackyanum]
MVRSNDFSRFQALTSRSNPRLCQRQEAIATPHQKQTRDKLLGS